MMITLIIFVIFATITIINSTLDFWFSLSWLSWVHYCERKKALRPTYPKSSREMCKRIFFLPFFSLFFFILTVKRSFFFFWDDIKELLIFYDRSKKQRQTVRAITWPKQSNYRWFEIPRDWSYIPCQHLYPVSLRRHYYTFSHANFIISNYVRAQQWK